MTHEKDEVWFTGPAGCLTEPRTIEDAADRLRQWGIRVYGIKDVDEQTGHGHIVVAANRLDDAELVAEGRPLRGWYHSDGTYGGPA